MEERRINGDRRNHLMSDQEISEWVSVSPNTVRYWRQTGILPFVKVGKHPRVWYSVLLQVFQKTHPNLEDGVGKMPLAGGGIRRQS